jgi:FkbM family methyltransferase
VAGTRRSIVGKVLRHMDLAARKVSWCVRSAVGAGATVGLPGAKTRLRLWPGHSLSRSIFCKGAFEPEVTGFLRCCLKAGMTYVDVGANIGHFVVIAAELVGRGGYVHAFEPSEIEVDRLRVNVALNGMSQVRINCCALSDRAGTVELLDFGARYGAYNTVGTRAHPDAPRKGGRVRVVPSTTLDGYFAGLVSPRPDVIKIDAEGAELLILRGSQEILSSSPGPVVICEVSDLTTSGLGYSASEIRGYLMEMGYVEYGWNPTTGAPYQLGEKAEYWLGNRMYARAGRWRTAS